MTDPAHRPAWSRRAGRSLWISLGVLILVLAACGRREAVSKSALYEPGTPLPGMEFVAAPLPPEPPARRCPNEAMLARRFAPALAIAPDDEAPRPVEILLDRARLVQREGERLIEEARFDAARLGAMPNQTDAFLRLTPAVDDREANRRMYDEALKGDRTGRYAVTAYARVACAQTNPGMGERTVIQYWLFYLYNDAWNVHQGDWEMVQIVLDGEGRPQYAAYAQHNTYSWRPWDEVLVDTRDSDGDGQAEEHPRVYVARGSHASYFQYTPEGYGGDRVTDTKDFIIPVIRMLPGPDDDTTGFSWLRFGGRWGEVPAKGVSCKNCDPGPVGPLYNSGGSKWTTPLDWGSQRLTRSDLLANKVAKVRVVGALAVHAYDSQNRHTGPGAGGRLEVGIPGAAHLTRPNSRSTSVLLPNVTPRTPARVELEGGEVTEVQVLVPDGAALVEARFPAVSLGTRGLARLEFGKASLTLLVDADRDGTFERTVYPLAPAAPNVQ